MNNPNTSTANLAGPLARRDLIAILAYVNAGARSARCLDGTFDRAEVHLNRLVAAAGMQ
ncbi:MAG: hypothetical protein ABI454_07055 [Sphingomicrobium sp.]